MSLIHTKWEIYIRLNDVFIPSVLKYSYKLKPYKKYVIPPSILLPLLKTSRKPSLSAFKNITSHAKSETKRKETKLLEKYNLFINFEVTN